MQKRSNLTRRAWAVGDAAVAHFLMLLALGWRIPHIVEPQSADDHDAAIEVTLVRPEARPRPEAPPTAPKSAPLAPPSAARVLVTPTPGAPALPAPPVAPPSAVAGGPADCATEDLPLLTDAEKVRCRNAVDADKERRLAHDADKRAARQVAEAHRMPQGYRMDAGKEAYFSAVADAYWQQTHGPPDAGRHPGVTCSAGKPANSLKIGPLPCYVTPPQGFLTEESGIPRP